MGKKRERTKKKEDNINSPAVWFRDSWQRTDVRSQFKPKGNLQRVRHFCRCDLFFIKHLLIFFPHTIFVYNHRTSLIPNIFKKLFCFLADGKQLKIDKISRSKTAYYKYTHTHTLTHIQENCHYLSFAFISPSLPSRNNWIYHQIEVSCYFI